MDVRDLSTPDILHSLSKNSDVRTYVMYGSSHNKATVSMLCKEYGKGVVILHGNERSGEPVNDSFADVITLSAKAVFVTGDPARRFLMEKGISAPIGFFECPIASLSRKSKKSDPLDVVYITTGTGIDIKHISELQNSSYTIRVHDLSTISGDSLRSLYQDLANTTYIVSDSFVFDKPARHLGKHFFYVGIDVLDYENLGISTHMVSKKLDILDYVKQKWKPVQIKNDQYGLQSLLTKL